jgi:hypothetical protein
MFIMSTVDIRFKIRPFPRVATYPTSWAGSLSSPQLYDDLAYYVTNVMKGKASTALTICPTTSSMGLWHSGLNSSKTRTSSHINPPAGGVFYSGAVQDFHAVFDDKYDSLEALMNYDWRNTWYEHKVTGFSAPSGWWNSVEQWATWVTDIDVRIEVEQIMRKLAKKYVDSFKHLVALYTVTTQVTCKDAAALAGVTPWN